VTTKSLIIASMSETFDPARQEPLGPWCFAGKEHLYPDWDKIAFFKFRMTRDELTGWYQKSELLCHLLIKEKGEALNQAHRTKYGQHYWRELLLPWISSIINAVVSRYLYFRDFVKSKPGVTFDVDLVETSNVTWRIRDAAALVKTATQPAFNEWLWSLIVKVFGPEHWKIRITTPGSAEEPYEGADVSDIATAPISRSHLRSALGRLSFSDVPGVRLGSLFFSVYINMLPRRPAARSALVVDPDVRSRFPSELLDLVDVVLAATKPVSLSEGFEERDQLAGQKVYKSGRLHVSGSTKFNENLRFENARATEAGERMVRVQHGGTPGVALVNVGYWYDLGYHPYLSWGWSDRYAEHHDVRPLPSPLLSARTNTHKKRRDQVLLIGTNMLSDIQIFRAAPFPADLLGYRRDKLDFVNNLPAGPRRRLRYRPYSRAMQGFEDETFMRKHCPDISISGESFRNDLYGSSILALDHPGTTLLMVLAANCPTVCFWRPEQWWFTPAAEQIFTEFKQVGLLYENPKDASSFIGETWTEIDTWWRSDAIQNARRRFCRQFARRSPFWWWHWSKTLAHL